MLHNEHFFLITQNKLKTSMKTNNSMDILQGNFVKLRNDYDVIK